jgi:hypothetical protein
MRQLQRVRVHNRPVCARQRRTSLPQFPLTEQGYNKRLCLNDQTMNSCVLEWVMNILRGAVRTVTGAADATTAVAGAVGGAAVDGVIGAVQGAAAGLRNGVGDGSHSTAAAALTLAAIGAAGLVEWPILLAVGGTALLVHQLNRPARENGQADRKAVNSSSRRGAPAKAAPVKSAARSARAPARKSTRPRRAPAQ